MKCRILTMANLTSSISKLVEMYDPKKHLDWTARFRVFMKSHAKWRYFVEDPPVDDAEKQAFNVESQRCLEALLLRMPPNLLLVLQAFEDKDGGAKFAWERLKEEYEQTGIYGKLELRREVTMVHMEEGEGMRSYLDRCEVLWRRGIEIGAEIDEKNFLLTVLQGLSADWDNIHADIDKLVDPWTTTKVFSRLIQEANRREAREKARANLARVYQVGSISKSSEFATDSLRRSNSDRSTLPSSRFKGSQKRNFSQGGSQGKRGRSQSRSPSPSPSKGRSLGRDTRTGSPKKVRFDVGRGGKKPSVKEPCHYCKLPSHFWRDCPDRPSTWTPTGFVSFLSHDDDEPEVWVVAGTHALSAPVYKESEEFVVDSGCMVHMTPHGEWFSSMKTPSYKGVFVGNGAKLQAKGEGNVHMTLEETGNDIILSNVLWVPGLAASLLSVNVLDKKGLHADFGSNQCVVSKGSEVKAIAHLTKDLYRLKVKVHKSQKRSAILPHDDL
jgi:hypothetical protein